MQSIKKIKSNFEQAMILCLLLLLICSFISLAFYVVEKNVNDLMGTFETPSVIYFNQETYVEVIYPKTQQNADHKNHQTIIRENFANENQGKGINNLAMVLDARIEEKAHVGIVWIVNKITLGLEYVADLLSKTLQSS